MKCEIQFRNQTGRVFRAGDDLDGIVVLSFKRATVINEISCQITGRAKCAWRVESSLYYFQTYHGRVDHLTANFILLHKPRFGQGFNPGKHNFNFYFQLPPTLPSTYKSTEGTVKYKISVVVKRFGKSDSQFYYPFVVTRIVDLNEFNPPLTRPLLKVTSKEFIIDYTSKALYMTAMIPQQGYTPNQIIDIRTQIDNRTIVYVKYVKISLKKIVVFTSLEPQMQSKEVEVTETAVYCGDVPSHAKRTFIKYLKVPLLVPNVDNCDIIRVSYVVQVKAKTVGVTKSPVIKLPIQIGTRGLFRDSTIDYEMDLPMTSRLEFAPMSYDECMRRSGPVTPSSGDNNDLIDFTLPSYEEAITMTNENEGESSMQK